MSSDASTRIRELCTWSTALSGFGSRVRVVTRGLAPACTRGLFRPRIELEAALVMRLDDDELEATLLHELEHANARDPLRFFLAYVALSINPLGSLLSSELARYHFAREAACDRSAVRRGADPLALARSIVSVAAPKAAPVAAAALGGHSIEAVHVRVELLLGYAAHRSAPAVREAPIGVVASLIVLLAMSPHFLGAAPLDVFHQGVEQTALLFGLG
jgi:beta-lactamase regulating signal transducer with metallopeptidase domain